MKIEGASEIHVYRGRYGVGVVSMDFGGCYVTCRALMPRRLCFVCDQAGRCETMTLPAPGLAGVEGWPSRLMLEGLERVYFGYPMDEDAAVLVRTYFEGAFSMANAAHCLAQVRWKPSDFAPACSKGG